jgi:type I restriction enzyme, S subunit
MNSKQSPFGQIPAEWNLARLKDITTKIGSGATPRGGKEVYLSQRETFALIRSQNVFDRYFNWEGLVYISDEHAEELRQVWLQPDDILLNITGDGITFSRACIIPERVLPSTVNQHVSILRVNANICDAGFLLSYLTHPQIKNYIESFNSGGSRRAITKGHIESFEIPLPPLREQKAIAAVLSAFDDKIELNRQMNTTLEETARALFKSWFVDFDPVRRNQAGQPCQPYDHLFPDRLVVDGNGRWVPEGWYYEPIGKHITATKGLSYKGEFLADSGTPMHNLNSVYEGGGYKYVGIKYYSGKYQEQHIVQPGDIIVTNTEQGFERLLLGYPAIVPELFGDWGIYSHHIFRVRAKLKSPLSNLFVYYLLRNQIYHDLVSGFGNGTTVNMLPADALGKPEIIIPPKAIVERFEEIAKPMLSQHEANYTESRTLADLRDTLLPRLMSGRLRVPG